MDYNDIILSDVLIVPNLETNLILVRKLEMKGFQIIFEDGTGKICHGHNIAAIAYRKHKLYKLDLSTGILEERALNGEIISNCGTNV